MTPVQLASVGAVVTAAAVVALPWRAALLRRPASIGGRPLVTSVAAGLATALLLGGVGGAVAGLVVAAGTSVAIRRLPTQAQRAEQERLAADLPLAADLLAATLRAGVPTDQAVLAVGEALDGPLSERFTRVGRALRLGASPEEAWAYLGDAAEVGRLRRTAVRSAASGAAMASGLTRLGEELRAARVGTAEASARRAGVLVVLPLGLCFLPAFVLAGLVPVVVALFNDVWKP